MAAACSPLPLYHVLLSVSYTRRKAIRQAGLLLPHEMKKSNGCSDEKKSYLHCHDFMA